MITAEQARKKTLNQKQIDELLAKRKKDALEAGLKTAKEALAKMVDEALVEGFRAIDVNVTKDMVKQITKFAKSKGYEITSEEITVPESQDKVFNLVIRWMDEEKKDE